MAIVLTPTTYQIFIAIIACRAALIIIINDILLPESHLV